MTNIASTAAVRVVQIACLIVIGASVGGHGPRAPLTADTTTVRPR